MATIYVGSWWPILARFGLRRPILANIALWWLKQFKTDFHIFCLAYAIKPEAVREIVIYPSQIGCNFAVTGVRSRKNKKKLFVCVVIYDCDDVGFSTKVNNEAVYRNQGRRLWWR